MMKKEFEEPIIKEVYKYCDNNIGETILFTGFVFAGFDGLNRGEANSQDLTNLVSNILLNLTEKGILTEVRQKENEFIYPFYKVLYHEKLIPESKRR
ncbi:Uncharacterised protein [uncultured archaeon]|nr:Uncharacterised protein [uncultured archaeon]